MLGDALSFSCAHCISFSLGTCRDSCDELGTTRKGGGGGSYLLEVGRDVVDAEEKEEGGMVLRVADGRLGAK